MLVLVDKNICSVSATRELQGVYCIEPSDNLIVDHSREGHFKNKKSKKKKNLVNMLY